MPKLFEKRGLFLGRFQPFHNGHLKVIQEIKSKVEELIIVIGSAQESHTQINPFTDNEREEMIEQSLRALSMVNYQIVPIDDINDDAHYVSHIEAQVPEFQLVFAADNPQTDKLFREKRYATWTCSRYLGIMSTRIRGMMLKNDDAWKNLVPKATVDVIDEIDGIKRIQQIYKQ